MTESGEGNSVNREPTPEIKGRIIGPSVRLVARIFGEEPVPVPIAYEEEYEEIASEALKSTTEARRKAVKEMCGFNGNVPNYQEAARKLGVSATTARTNALSGYRNIFYNLRKDDPELLSRLHDLAPVDSCSIARSMFGARINREVETLIPPVPFNQLALSSRTVEALSKHLPTLGYSDMTLSMIGSVQDMGLPKDVVSELKSKAIQFSTQQQ